MLHFPDESLERYSMATLRDDAEAGPLEEHLLTCAACQERLKATDEFVAAMRAAAAKLRDEEG
jgi:anti-sigma factor RsiW